MNSNFYRAYFLRTAIATITVATISITGCNQIRALTSGDPAPSPETVIDVPSDAVAMINGFPILLEEMLAQYNRSAVLESETIQDPKSEYLDFLNRYVGYRVKILEAEAAGYNVDPELVAESELYRNQLAWPYLLKNEVTDPLVKEYYARRQTMVSASHILIKLGQNPSPADTSVAWHSMQNIVDSLNNGVDFGDVAFRFSEDPSASRLPIGKGYRGDLGYFGAGSVVYEFENAAYNTDPGSLSKVFRTQFGYHILLVRDRIPFPEDLRLAHIMIRVAGISPVDSAAARSQIDGIESELQAGADFAELAAEFSSDTATGSNGGELQRIKYDSGLPPTMRDAAFDLSVGEITGVIESPFGYHIIKLLGHYPNDSLDDSYEDIRIKIAQLPRSKSAEESWKSQARASYDIEIDSEFLLEWAASPDANRDGSDSGTDGGKDSGTENSIVERGSSSIVDSVAQHKIVSIDTMTFKLQDFIDSQESSRAAQPVVNRSNVLDRVDKYVSDLVVEREISELESHDTEFATTMTEFRRGLLLFRLMEDSVWTAAAVDSAGLHAYYLSRADSFQFGDRTRVISLSVSSDSIATGIVESVRVSGEIDGLVSALNADTMSTVRIDTTYIEGETGSIYDQISSLSEGAITDPIPYNSGFIVLYHAGVDPARQRTFDEARALAVTGYQEILDTRLVERLYLKYGVTTYPGVLDSLFDEPAN